MKEMTFDSLEHEVLYEFFNANGITDKTEFDGISYGSSFANAIEEIKMLSKNTEYFYISYPKNKWYGSIIFFIKCFIVKILRWYINPFIKKQNRFNAEIITILKTMHKDIEELKNEISDLRQNKRQE